jgi:hypothetical protein
MSTGHCIQKFCDISKSSQARQPLQYLSHTDLASDADNNSQGTFVKNLSLSLMNFPALMRSVSILDLAPLYLGSEYKTKKFFATLAFI